MIIKRYEHNPILKPNRAQSWEAEAVFNGCPVKKREETFMVYRALSQPHYHTSARTKMMMSDIGICQSKDGKHFTNRRRFIIPEEPWERFGCEDPRITYLDNKYYIFYTALSTYPFGPEGIKVGLAISKNLESIEKKHLVTPFNAKGMALFPQKVNGKYYAVLTVNTDIPPGKICIAEFEKESDIWNPDYWNTWYKNFSKHSLNLVRYPVDHVEVGAPPVLTKYGWLLIYSYIRNYYTDHKLFTIEAVLLNKDNPKEILARTDMPILSPEEYYEKIGIVPNIVFPSGVLIEGDWLNLYYGAADTTVCLCEIELSSLLEVMLQSKKRNIKLTRAKTNPILEPIISNPWESKAVFNPAAIYLDNKVHILYRAMSGDNTSVIGYADSDDGLNISTRLKEPIYTPQEDFEQKASSNSFSGCEDPRLTIIDDKIYMCYTAFNGKDVPRVALTSIEKHDFLNKNWKWKKPVLISPPDCDDKDAYVFPEKVEGKYMIIHRCGVDIDYSLHETLDFDGKTWLEEYRWISPRIGWWDSKKVGIAADAIKTNAGWVQLYHGVSDSGKYRVGALLLSKDNPTTVIGRTENPIFEPEKIYEQKGLVPNVVFPCGNILKDGKLFVYYGGADKVVGAATIEMEELINVLKLCRV